MFFNSLSSFSSWGLIFPLAFVPSIVWLFIFWVQDKHREPKHIILAVFVWGILVAIPVLLLELVAQETLLPLVQHTPIEWLYGFIGVAFIEESAKYLVVRSKAIPREDFDEPQDAMMYMMTAALGFAALENFFYTLQAIHAVAASPFVFLAGRFFTATFLHVIASGILGYFVALTFFVFPKGSTWQRVQSPFSYRFLMLGMVLSTILHGLYNNFIIQAQSIIPLALLFGGGLLLLLSYWHLRKLAR